MLSKQAEKRFANTSDTHRANGLSGEYFFGSCFGTSVGMQARDRCLRLRKGGRLESW